MLTSILHQRACRNTRVFPGRRRCLWGHSGAERPQNSSIHRVCRLDGGRTCGLRPLGHGAGLNALPLVNSPARRLGLRSTTRFLTRCSLALPACSSPSLPRRCPRRPLGGGHHNAGGRAPLQLILVWASTPGASTPCLLWAAARAGERVGVLTSCWGRPVRCLGTAAPGSLALSGGRARRTRSVAHWGVRQPWRCWGSAVHPSPAAGSLRSADDAGRFPRALPHHAARVARAHGRGTVCASKPWAVFPAYGQTPS
jgi:hypothetical protein